MSRFFSLKGLTGLSLFGALCLFPVSACLSNALEPVEDGSPVGIIWKLNKNVEGLKNLANTCMKNDSISVFSIRYNDDQSVLYWLGTKESGDIELYSEIVSEDVLVPELSMGWVGNEICWTINGDFLKDLDGERVAVSDVTRPVSFVLHKDVICCLVNNRRVAEFPYTRTEFDYLAKDVAVDYDVERREFSIHLSSGFITTIPAVSDFRLLEEKVQNRSFYKDVFLDAGVQLRPRHTLPAAIFLKSSLECLDLPHTDYTAKDLAVQKDIIVGNSTDLNGRLLYPDGQPRYRLLYVNGGNSTSHGQSLGKEGLENMRTFVKNGGSYLGICAGAFLASNGYDGKSNYPHYLSIWPGMMQHTGLKDLRFGMFIEKNSPLLDYYSFGDDSYVDSVYHSSGGYPTDFPLKTEILARYDYSKKSAVHRKPSIWAYKETDRTGRIVMSGSHPESYISGERLQLTAAMMRYAMDGQGTVSVKGFLKNGEERVMDKKTSDNSPSYTRIGDLQTHHFAAYIPADAKNVRVEVKSSSKCDLALMMNQGTYAFSDVAEYRTTASGASQQLFFPSIREGLWFIGVQCLTTVTVTETDYGQEYSGNLEVLNGIPYRISISWE